ncbi:hypothetical protein ACHAPJ_010862 [Fusarium lateritium]
MGGPPSPKRGYRDDPDALSLHTTPGDAFTENIVDEGLDTAGPPPPAYHDATANNDMGRMIIPPQVTNDTVLEEDNYYTGVSLPETHIAYESRRIGSKRTRIGNEVIPLQDKRSDHDPEFLESWIRIMSRYPPSPYINIVGTHRQTKRDKDGKSSSEEVTDFRIMVNLQNYLWPNFIPNALGSMSLVTAESGEKTYRGTVLKKRAPGAKGDIEVGHDKPDLKEWCHRYCAKATSTRVFRLTRTVTGFDEQLFRTRLSGLIRSTNYKGKLSIEFPVADRAVDIYSSNRLNTWRLMTWLRWVFYLTFLWIFSWPVLFFSTKRYRVVRAEWPYSKVNAEGQKVYTTVSEEQWVSRYGPAIKQLCLDRYQGLAGDTFLTQVLEREETHQENNGQVDGRAALSAAAAAFQGGRFNAASGVSSLMRFAGGSNDQIGWGFDT